MTRIRLWSYVKKNKIKPPVFSVERGDFENLTRINSRGYDEVLSYKIQKIRPFWFVKSSNTKKQEILNIACTGGEKPLQSTRLGQALRSYYYKCGGSYDVDFERGIRKIRPDWCIPERWYMLQRQLLSMARAGRRRPSTATKLGNAFLRFTTPPDLVKRERIRTYNPVFKCKIKKARPDWLKIVHWKDGKKIIRVV